MNTINVNNIKNIYIDKYNRKQKIKMIYKKDIKNEDIRKYINNYDYLKTFLKINKTNKIYEINPQELLSPINYDIFIKYLYLKNKKNKLYKKMYLNHIKAFNNYKEPDGSKNSKKDFLNACNNFIKNNGYTNTIIPISKQGIIIDGSHRIAISIIKNQNVLCTDFEANDLYFDFNFFIKRGFKKEYCEYIGFVIIELVKNISFIKIDYSKNSLKKKLKKINDSYDIYYYIRKKNKVLLLVSSNNMNDKKKNLTYDKNLIKMEYAKFVKKRIFRKGKELNLW